MSETEAMENSPEQRRNPPLDPLRGHGRLLHGRHRRSRACQPGRPPRLGGPGGRGTQPRPQRLRLRQPGGPRPAPAADRGPAAGPLPLPQAGPRDAFRRRQRPDPARRRPGSAGRKAGLRGADPEPGRRHGGPVQRPGHRLLRAGADPQQGGHLQREPPHHRRPPRCRHRGHVGAAPAERSADVGRGPPAFLPAGPPHHRRHGAGLAQRPAHPGAPLPQTPAAAQLAGGPLGDLVWAREYFVPWVVRRLRHRSSGDGITAKRPLPGPVFGPGVPLGSGEGPPGAQDPVRS